MGVTRLCLVGRLCAVGRLWNDKINDYACTTSAHTIESAKVRRIFGMCKFICYILIKNRVPLFPRGLKGTKNLWDNEKRTTSNGPSGGPEDGAATPVYAENAVYAVCAPCGNADSLQEFEQLVEAIEAAGVDITSDYNDWYKIAIAIANIYIYLIYI